MLCATAPGPSVAFSSSAAIAAVVSFACGPVIPLDDERLQSFLRRAHMIGDDGHGIVEPHDLPHAFHGKRRSIVHAFQTAAEYR